MTENSDSNHVGPIVFSNEIARNQLIDEGVVTTFRTRERTVGETWWRESRTGEKRGDCTVEVVCECDPSVHAQLDQFVSTSGFESVAEWQDSIKQLHDGDIPHTGWIYRVTPR